MPQSRMTFSPFFLSVDGILRKEALVVLSGFSRLMAEKHEEPMSQVQGWINGRIAIVVTRLYYSMIHGARLPSPLREQEPDWNKG